MSDDSSHLTDDTPTPDEPNNNDAEPMREIEETEEADGVEKPLARVRYGLGKELLLYPDSFVIAYLEEHTETGFNLANIRRMILAPGDPNPSKLVLMFELDDDNIVIAAEGMSNVRDFRKLLP